MGVVPASRKASRRAGGSSHPIGHRLRIVGDLRRRLPLHRTKEEDHDAAQSPYRTRGDHHGGRGRVQRRQRVGAWVLPRWWLWLIRLRWALRTCRPSTRPILSPRPDERPSDQRKRWHRVLLDACGREVHSQCVPKIEERLSPSDTKPCRGDRTARQTARQNAAGRQRTTHRSASRCLSSRSSHRLRRVVGLRTGHREAPRGRGMSRGSELTRGAPLTDIRATKRGRRRSAGLAVGRSRHRDWPQRHGGSRRSEAGRRQVPGEVPERPRGRARRLSAVPEAAASGAACGRVRRRGRR